MTAPADGFRVGAPRATAARRGPPRRGWRKRAREALVEERAVAFVLDDRCGERVGERRALDADDGRGLGGVYSLRDAHRNARGAKVRDQGAKPCLHSARARKRCAPIVQRCGVAPPRGGRTFTYFRGIAVADRGLACSRSPRSCSSSS